MAFRRLCTNEPLSALILKAMDNGKDIALPEILAKLPKDVKKSSFNATINNLKAARKLPLLDGAFTRL